MMPKPKLSGIIIKNSGLTVRLKISTGLVYKSKEVVLIAYYRNFVIRSCGIEKGLENCSLCEEAESCGKLDDFFKFSPEPKVCFTALLK
jgi:hypothetical protein